MCWGSMQINYTIKHWGWGDCCALPNSPKSREKLSPVIHYQCVFCRVNIEMCVPYLQWYYAGQQTYISERKKKKKRKSKKMTGFQATTISSDLTPCMLLPVVLSQQCRDLCWHGCHFCRACHSEAALSGCYHPWCFPRKSVKSREVHRSQREVLIRDCEKRGVGRGCLSVCLIDS